MERGAERPAFFVLEFITVLLSSRATFRHLPASPSQRGLLAVKRRLRPDPCLFLKGRSGRELHGKKVQVITNSFGIYAKIIGSVISCLRKLALVS